MAKVVEKEWGLRAIRLEALEPFEHAFTHFTLEVSPWRIQVRGDWTAADGRAATWLSLSELEGAALPAPVRRLLSGLK